MGSYSHRHLNSWQHLLGLSWSASSPPPHQDDAGGDAFLRTVAPEAPGNRKQAGFVVAESERVCFDGRDNRRRATLIDFSKTKVVTADDFPQRDGTGVSDAAGEPPRSTFRPRHAWNDAS